MNKKITIATFDTEVYKIDGPLHEGLMIASGEGSIKMGQVVSFDDATGKLVKHISDSAVAAGAAETPPVTLVANKAHSIVYLSNGEDEVDASTEDKRVSILRGISRFNKKHIVGMDPDVDFRSVRELWENGIYLEEVTGGDE